MAPYTGEYFIPLAAEHREAAGVAAGEEVDVRHRARHRSRARCRCPTTSPPPSTSRPAASFDALAYSHQKEWVRWVEEAKKPETRAARIEKTVESLRAGKKAR